MNTKLKGSPLEKLVVKWENAFITQGHTEKLRLDLFIFDIDLYLGLDSIQC